MATEMGPRGSVNRAQITRFQREVSEAAPLDDEAFRPAITTPSIHPISVAPAGIRHLPALRRLEDHYRLNQPTSLLEPTSPLRSGLAAAVPGVRRSRPAFVALADDRLVGFANFASHRSSERWVLLGLDSSVGVFEVDPVWEALLTHAIRQAGLRGVKRLHVRLPRNVPAGDALLRLGWSRYAEETVFARHGPVMSRSAVKLRPQRADDTWAILQLYHLVVPRPVQHAEAYTSHQWDLNRNRRTGSGRAAKGWILEDGGHVIGYARIASRGETHIVELLYHPDRRDRLQDLIQGALASLSGGPARRVYCALRGYQAEAQTALEERGFEPMIQQDLLVKYTTAQVRLPAFEPVPFHVDMREKLPRQVPTFLHGTPRDRSAN